MKPTVGYIILGIFLGYVLYELLTIVLAYPIGALSGAGNWNPDSAMLVDKTLSALIATLAVVLLIWFRRKKGGGGKGEKS